MEFRAKTTETKESADVAGKGRLELMGLRD
jgi:hypothetical protein